MNDDIITNSQKTNRAAGMMQYEEIAKERTVEQQGMQQQAQMVQGVACPFCGTVNEPTAAFCANCGKPIGMSSCPNCGSEIEPDADFCEACHHYIKKDVCSFCGAQLTGQEAYCPECGNPRGGIVCPTCHTLNDFAFCKQCGTALTDEARNMVAELKKTPEYLELSKLADEFADLNMQLPIVTERDRVHENENARLRQRVLALLAKDKGMPNLVIPARPSKRMSKEELDARKKEMLDKLSDVLDRMAIPAMPSPAKVRNYAMAQKPLGVRLAWVCNYKHAMHSSPCGCAKPQLGGKWVILGKNNKDEIKDDK